MAHQIEYSPEAAAHLRALTAHQRKTVLDSVDRQLTHLPTRETRNRKPMRPNQLAPWELRVGNLRVYYDVQEHPRPLVIVLAVGLKLRNRVRIGDEEIQL